MLFAGAEFSLTSAEKIGKKLGLSPLIIGLFIIGFGTSLPELFVSQLAAYHGDGELAMGNIVGSNIANGLLILGVASMMVSLPIGGREINKQLILHLVLTCLLSLVLMQDGLMWWSGLLLIAFFFFYLTESLMEMRKTHRKMTQEDEKDAESLHPLLYVKLVGGFILLYFGGDFLVESGGRLAKMLGVSSYVISAILIAFGTSFPELVTAILSCYRKKDTGLIIGNVIGSNIFNVALVMASITPHNVIFGRNFKSEILILMAFSLFMLLLSFLKKRLNIFTGLLFLFSYITVIMSWL